ncbi:interferon-inducible double-stranded RNA-dependent protein kinase activator A homolog A-like [Daphnia pulex]|uniref:interferon-inducible double-stranded RNA-dependent protein kinase activator A homolog A-like n=1 Tax=Daphnia pulex TaxID=6669 RepID=UPI001EE0C432|nr:interferon-inducible double-stranded RNA-dependent protein kinase activator A homolog A-like [Daphnia pulex]
MEQVSLRPSSAKQEKTFVSVFHELCKKFEFGVAKYSLAAELPHSRTFLMNLTVDILGITVQGIGLTKMQAKHDAAYKMMFQIRETYQAGGTINTVPRVKLVNCCEWLEKLGTLKEDIPKPPTEPTLNPAEVLTEWRLTRHSTLPEYRVVRTSGPSHSKTYFMTCKLSERVTEGEGKSKQAAKNDAAEKMLQILEDEEL